MAHCVEQMMYNGKEPWHIGQTNSVRLADEEVYDMGIGIVKSGLDWDVELMPLYLKLPSLRSDGVSDTFTEVAVDRFAVVRKSDNSILGNVGPKYVPLQNREAFKFFNPFLESKAARLHTAGSLLGGRVVWVLCHLTGFNGQVVKGDRVDRFALLSSSHDGSMAVRVGFTDVRVVCRNTVQLAHNSTSSKLLRVRHTKSVHANLEAIRDTMNMAKAEFEATLEQYRRLANVHINQSDVRKYVKLVLNIKEELPLDEIPTRTRNVLFSIEQLAQRGTGTNIPGVEGTLWAAYNGVTEYLSYGKGSNPEKRLDSLWFGSSADTSKRAFELALQMAS